MSATLLRLGLWIAILVLILYVVAEAFAEQPFAALISVAMLQQALVLAGLLIVAGIVARVLGKGAKVVTKNRCQVCRTPIPPGAMFCRAHLRSILHEEDDKSHMTRVKQ